MPGDGRRLLITLALTFGVALAIRLIHVWQMRETLFSSMLIGDSRGYDAWARQIAAGDWVGRDVFYQAPLYPYFLAGIYATVGHDLVIVRLIQAAVGATSCLALAYAVTRLISPRAGLAAGMMLACYPAAIFFDGLIQKSVLDVVLISGMLAVLAHILSHETSLRAWLVLGITMGALALTRENALVLALVLGLWAMTRVRQGAAVFVCGFALVLLPVAIRNYAVGGGFHLTTSQFGSNLYIGNNPQADGSYMSLVEGRGSPEYERADAISLAERAAGRQLTPAEVSSYWTSRTLSYIRRQPGDWLALLARKARLLVSSTEVIDTESQESHEEYSWPLRLTGAIWHFGVLLPLAVVGAIVLWPRRHRLWPIYAVTLAYALSVVVFYVVARYRLPLVPLLIVFAAAAVASVPPVPGAAVLLPALAIGVLSNWPLYTPESQRAITENNLGTALQEAGRLDDAIARYRRALALDPNYTAAMNNLGTALRAAGRTDEAIATYDAAIAGGPIANASVYLNRGNALMQDGRTSDAIRSFRQALAVDPESTSAQQALVNALYDAGTAAIDAGRFAQAEAALREAVGRRPDYAEAHNNLGISLASQGRIDEAIREWKEALRLAPNLTDAKRNLELAERQ